MGEAAVIWGRLTESFWLNCQLFGLTLLFAIPLGLVVAFGSMSRFAPLRGVVKTFVWAIRGTPLMLQLIIIFYIPGYLLQSGSPWPSGESGRFLASAVASLTQPLFNKGANIAQLKIAKAQQEEARLSFEQTLLNAGVEVNEALVQYQTAREKADYYNKQVASLQTAAKSTSLLMKHGNTTYLEVLTAQQTLLNAQLSQVANRFTEIQGVITLYQALGGGRM